MNIVTPAEMEEIDRATIKDHGLNSLVLMENAAQISKLVRTHQDPLNELHLRLFAQPADDDQRRWAEEFLQKSGGKDAAWAVLCHTLLISNDFLYLR